MPKILIVEDDPAVRDVVEHALSREGMGTLAVVNGEAALKRLSSPGEDVDLVVLDVMLPGMDDVSVCSVSWASSWRSRQSSWPKSL